MSAPDYLLQPGTIPPAVNLELQVSHFIFTLIIHRVRSDDIHSNFFLLASVHIESQDILRDGVIVHTSCSSETATCRWDGCLGYIYIYVLPLLGCHGVRATVS